MSLGLSNRGGVCLCVNRGERKKKEKKKESTEKKIE